MTNWKASNNDVRKTRRVRFPRFKSRCADGDRVRFTTGTMRVEDDRRTIRVPVIGGLRSKESTRRVQRHLATGRARILNMTLSQRWGRLFVSVNYALPTAATPTAVAPPTVRAGMDLGIRTLATVATIDTDTGAETVVEYPIRPRLRRPSPRGGGPGVNFLAAFLDRAATGQRKPSCPGWTAGACICGGKPPIGSPPSWRAAMAAS